VTSPVPSGPGATPGNTATQLGDDPVLVAARRLQAAAQSRTPCAPVRDLLGSSDVTGAYAVQDKLTTERLASGARVVGRKIGLTSPAVQRQLGVDRPDFGTLFDDMRVPTGQVVPTDGLLQPRVEAEIAFVLGADIDDPDDVRTSIAYAVAALEICDSRIAGWDISITDTIADNASSALFVLGTDRVDLRDFEPASVAMELFIDGTIGSSGTGAACLGDPLNALAWLARAALAVGAPLKAGEIVLSGALGPMVDVRPGMAVRAEITELGRVEAVFATPEGHNT
jgi:2-keto-4-pentenoate hydratase